LILWGMRMCGFIGGLLLLAYFSDQMVHTAILQKKRDGIILVPRLFELRMV
jgi:hypothetical protein